MYGMTMDTLVVNGNGYTHIYNVKCKVNRAQINVSAPAKVLRAIFNLLGISSNYTLRNFRIIVSKDKTLEMCCSIEWQLRSSGRRKLLLVGF